VCAASNSTSKKAKLLNAECFRTFFRNAAISLHEGEADVGEVFHADAGASRRDSAGARRQRCARYRDDRNRQNAGLPHPGDRTALEAKYPRHQRPRARAHARTRHAGCGAVQRPARQAAYARGAGRRRIIRRRAAPGHPQRRALRSRHSRPLGRLSGSQAFPL